MQPFHAPDLALLSFALAKLMELFNDPRWVDQRGWLIEVINTVQSVIRQSTVPALPE